MKTKHTERMAFALAVALSFASLANAQDVAPVSDARRPRLITRDTPIGKLPLLASRRESLTSPDLQHLAMPVTRGAKRFVWLPVAAPVSK
jgi:hypothetical protein